MDDHGLLSELTPVATRLLERHLDVAKEWFPHELVPWNRAGVSEPESPLGLTVMPRGVRSALFINLLTEDNLPYYFDSIARTFGTAGPWGAWVRRWTAEEGRHSIVLRDYLTVSRHVDPILLERARMAQVCGAVVPHPSSAVDGLVYVALQEVATRVAHLNTGKAMDDPAGYAVMKRVAADENLHHLFYRDLVSAALDVDPSSTVEALERQVAGFAMPGVGIPEFRRHAAAIARQRIYDLEIHYEAILRPLFAHHWVLDDLRDLSASAQESRSRLAAYLARAARVAQQVGDRAAARDGVVAGPA
jgi:acyl-[acyl-carrier-protein] desaturase